MLDLLKQVRQKAVIGFVGGSDLAKITEQLAVHGQNSQFAPLRSRLSTRTLLAENAPRQSPTTLTFALPRTA
jgi:hypothetical protein